MLVAFVCALQIAGLPIPTPDGQVIVAGTRISLASDGPQGQVIDLEEVTGLDLSRNIGVTCADRDCVRGLAFASLSGRGETGLLVGYNLESGGVSQIVTSGFNSGTDGAFLINDEMGVVIMHGEHETELPVLCRSASSCDTAAGAVYYVVRSNDSWRLMGPLSEIPSGWQVRLAPAPGGGDDGADNPAYLIWERGSDRYYHHVPIGRPVPDGVQPAVSGRIVAVSDAWWIIETMESADRFSASISALPADCVDRDCAEASAIFLGQVEAPFATRIYALAGDDLWMTASGPNGQYLHCWNIETRHQQEHEVEAGWTYSINRSYPPQWQDRVSAVRSKVGQRKQAVTLPECVETNSSTLDLEPYSYSHIEADEGVSVELLHVTSRDGTRVPVSLISPENAVSEAPLLVAAYGGFGLPNYGADYGSLVSFWLSQGGRVALAHVRGGGEFGVEWARAGIDNHLLTVEDLVAVRNLPEIAGIRPDAIVLRGGSFGAIVMLAAADAWPEVDHVIAEATPFRGGDDIPAALSAVLGQTVSGDFSGLPQVTLVQAANDLIVPPEAVRSWAALLDAQGVSYNLIFTETGGHGLSNERDSQGERIARDIMDVITQ